ncbi:MAG: M48 family metalloprotease [Vicinamibacterales bacterium]
MPQSMPPRRFAYRVPAVAAVLVGATLATACASNPVSGRREVSLISEAEEIELGRRGDAEIRREMGVYHDESLQRYVADIGERIAAVSHRPHLPWTFTVLDAQAVNAFALPGGFVYVTRGLLAHLGDEAELAGVLGHEVGHVTARHVSQQYTRSAGGSLAVLLASIFVPGVQPFGDLANVGLGTLFLKYGRDDELESDRLGVEYAAKAGWDPSGVPRFLETLSRLDAMSERGVPNWLSTHPDPGSRVVKARPVADQAGDGQAGERRRDDYLRRVDGLAYGDDPSEGVVRGHQFLHPDLRIAIDFPEGWEVQNAPDRVVARLEGQQALMVMQAASATRGASLDDAATRHMRGLGFRLESGLIEQLSGLDAFVGVYTGKAKGIGDVRVRAAHVTVGRQVYMLAGVAAKDEFPRVDADFTRALASFRELSGSEAATVRPNRIAVYVAKLGDSWQSIAQRAGNGLVPATRLALMNGFAVNVQPPAGTTLKIVVEG